MKITNCKGVSTVEFIISFSFVVVCLLLVLELFFFVFSGELLTYAFYMGARTEYVFGDSVKSIRSVSNWVAPEDINKTTYNKNGFQYTALSLEAKAPSILGAKTSFSLINNKWKINLEEKVPVDLPVVRDCEDNVLLWNVEVSSCL